MTARDGGAEVLVRVELSEDVFDVAESASNSRRKPRREVRELLLLLDRYAALRPQKGVIDEEAFLRLQEAADFSEAVRLGLRLLAFGASTRKGLEGKLCRKGVGRMAAVEASAYLSANGYINEEQDAVREAERNVKKLRGRNRIRAALYQKGYGPEAVESAEHYLDEVDFVQLCKTLVQQRYKEALSDASSRKRIVATLMRNGYTMREIRAAITEQSS